MKEHTKPVYMPTKLGSLGEIRFMQIDKILYFHPFSETCFVSLGDTGMLDLIPATVEQRQGTVCQLQGHTETPHTHSDHTN